MAGATEFGFKLRGSTVLYRVADNKLFFLDKSAPLAPQGNRIKMRILLDRTSLEVFGNDGEVTLTSNILPATAGLEVYAAGGPVRIVSLEAHKLRGAWDPKDLQAARDKVRRPSTWRRSAEGRPPISHPVRTGPRSIPVSTFSDVPSILFSEDDYDSILQQIRGDVRGRGELGPPDTLPKLYTTHPRQDDGFKKHPYRLRNLATARTRHIDLRRRAGQSDSLPKV